MGTRRAARASPLGKLPGREGGEPQQELAEGTPLCPPVVRSLTPRGFLCKWAGPGPGDTLQAASWESLMDWSVERAEDRHVAQGVPHLDVRVLWLMLLVSEAA